MKKLLIIYGPTATGKTGLGLKLAKKFKGEIINISKTNDNEAREAFKELNNIVDLILIDADKVIYSNVDYLLQLDSSSNIAIRYFVPENLTTIDLV